MLLYDMGELIFMNNVKRKTNTSSAVKMRYNRKTYEDVRAALPKELARDFKKKCKADGVPQAQVIKRAVEEFLA